MILRLVEKFDGLPIAVLQVIVDQLDNLLNNTNNDSALKREIFVQFNKETLGDLLVFLLVALNSIYTKNPTYTEIIKQFIINNFPALFEGITNTNSTSVFKSELINDKLCLFIAFYIDELFFEIKTNENREDYYYISEDNNSRISYLIEYLFINILQYQKCNGLAYQATYCLNKLLNFRNLKSMFFEKLNIAFPGFIAYIGECDVLLFFDSINDIIQFIDIEPSVLLALSQKIIKRALIEIKSNKDKEKFNEYLDKCFMILRTIVEFHLSKVENYGLFQQFEESIVDLVSYFKKPSKIEFDDEILELGTLIISNAKSPMLSSQIILGSITEYIIKLSGLNLQVFKFLKIYMEYTSEKYLIGNEFSDKLLTIFKSSFDDNEEAENSSNLACILIQIWLYVILFFY